MAGQEKPIVRAVECDHRASDEEIFQALKRATMPLERAWRRLKNAKRITIKMNQAWRQQDLVYFAGHLGELVDHRTARALLRLLREETSAELVCTEIATMAHHDPDLAVEDTITLRPVLEEFGVSFVDGDLQPHKVVSVPGGGSMFRQYLLPESVVDTDAFVSVQKLKNHKFMGVTLCLKNLFGLCPMPPHGRTRSYFHHVIRLPYILVDLGQMIKPTLNVIDGLVGQSGKEWGGDGRVCDVLVAGDNVFATDACGTHLMGLDPLGDWPNQPFVRERNSILIAHETGIGVGDLQGIDFQSEVAGPVGSFVTEETDPLETVLAWRRSTCEQALYYRDNVKKFVDRFAGEYILLQDGEVKWHSQLSEFRQSRRDLAGQKKQSAMWLKLVDPEEAEGEHFEVYERTLASLAAMGL